MAEDLKLTREYLLRIGGWSALKEAETILSAGKIEAVEFVPPFLSGRVKSGTTTVKSRIKLSQKLFEVENLCSCRQAQTQGTICPHVIALGLKFISASTTSSLLSRPHHHPIPPVAAPEAPSVQNPSPSIFVSESESDTPLSFLNLFFLLPLNLPESWSTGQMRVIVEGSHGEEPSRPLDTLLKTMPRPILVPPEALTAIRFLERRSKEPLLSMWLLGKEDFDGFFRSLVNCPTVSLGKKSSLVVRALNTSVNLRLRTEPDGRMHLSLAKAEYIPGIRLSSPKGTWSFGQGQLLFQSSLGPVLSQLENGPVLLNRTEVPRFLHDELPGLEKIADVTRCERTRQIELIERHPTIRATLDGTTSALSCKMEAVYEGTPVPLIGAIKSSATPWTPDPKNVLRYYSRSPQAEQSARQTLAQEGFQPGVKQPEFYVLSGEAACLQFLANQFPEWRTKWEIKVQPRLQSFLSQCDWIRPEATFSSSGIEWLNVDLTYRSENGAVELTPGEVQQLLQTGRCSRRLTSGRTALIANDQIEDWQEVLRDCHEEAGTGTLQVSKQFAPYLTSSLTDRTQSWTPPAELLTPQPVELPESLQKILRPYQHQGVEWIAYLASNGFGGILADEMGLGKTLQTLAFLLHRRQALLTRTPSLIVCPTSLLSNWQNETRRFTPSLRTLIWHGSDRHENLSQLGQVDLLITSYSVLLRDIELLRATVFSAIILDEAQQIKNRFSQRAKAVKLLNAPFRLILTGTPMENSLLDLWSMFDFLMPNYLGSAKSFRDRYELPITKTGDAAAQGRLTRRLKPFVLRRTKQEVAPELPAKIETILWTELSEEQKTVYQQVLQAGRKEIFNLSGKGDEGKRTIAMLTTLTRLRQVSCHLGLLPNTEETKWNQPSAKLESFWETLEEAIDGGHRVLVFSQFVKMLKLLEGRLKGEQIPYCYLDGSTEDREGEVAKFQNGPEIPVFLISLKAGGTGLNLTGADTVIHFDPWWNPAVEEQATARAHRIGQDRIVTSYKLIALGTVEEKILELQNRKRALLAQTVFNEQSLLQQLKPEEWKELLDFGA